MDNSTILINCGEDSNYLIVYDNYSLNIIHNMTIYNGYNIVGYENRTEV